MSDMKWTVEQNEAINRDGVNILVSAAAGSGKTTVLIERISRLIIEEGMDVDRFLITTFTNAAASEMKERLKARIEKKLDECGDDGAAIEFLRRQIRLLPEAHIETFHSFSISIIRDYFFLTDLQPGFTIGDEIRINLMKREVIDSVFERRFREDGDRFRPFLRKYSHERNDDRLKESILSVYTEMLSIPRYMDWAQERVARLADGSPVESLGIEAFIRAQTKARLLDAAGCYEEAAKLLDTADTENIHIKAGQDAEQIRALAGSIASDAKTPEDPGSSGGGSDGGASLEKMRELLDSIKLNVMRATKEEKDAYEAVKDEVQALRSRGKKYIDDLKKAYFVQERQLADESMRSLHDDTEYFLGIITEVEEKLNERKRDENIIDFDDAMHYAIKILDEEKAAADYRERFRYIFIDEYQDSNYLQEEIIERIRRKNNLFMVGDIKQSIYRFRLAEPDLFRCKYADFSREEVDGSEKIDLSSNFRSKGNIRRVVNEVFEDVMEGYDENAALKGPEGGGDPGPAAELHIIRKCRDEDVRSDDESDGLEEFDEAALVTALIKEQVGRPFIDRDGCERMLEYGDIAVLSRGGRAVSKFERHLNDEGIPAYGDTAGGYYETVEVRVFVDLLRIISNLRQDVPLIAVMSAMFFDFTPSELATIRIEFRDGSFCEAVEGYGDEGRDPEIREKIRSMITQIERWKEMSRTLPLEELIRTLLYETGYYDYCSSLPVGSRRISNLRLLLEKAQAFEKSSYSGLYGFLSYIEAMKNSRQKVNEASLSGEGEDVVRVMTVHKSKGLEFPMVILVGAGKRISGTSSGYDPAIDKDFSIGLPLIDRDMHTRSKTLLQQVISGKKKSEEVEEEIRILYVALTRAIDRLIVVGTVAESKTLSEIPMRGSYIEMIYPAMSSLSADDPDMARVFIHESRECEGSFGTPGDADGEMEAAVDFAHEERGADEETGEKTDIEEIDRKLSFRYPYAYAAGIRPKYSVTGIAAGMAGYDPEDEERPVDDRASRDISMLPPAVTKIPQLRGLEDDEGRLSDAQAGTVMHYIMEKIDFARGERGGVGYIEEFCSRLHERGVIDDREYEAVSVKGIAGFFDDPIGKRATKASRLRKEKEFLMQEMIEGEQIIVQGVIDCYFEEDDGLVLIDYKNSYLPKGQNGSVDPSIIADRYREQIRLYKRALEKAEKKPVKESWIYLFRSGSFIPVETD